MVTRKFRLGQAKEAFDAFSQGDTVKVLAKKRERSLKTPSFPLEGRGRQGLCNSVLIELCNQADQMVKDRWILAIGGEKIKFEAVQAKIPK